MTEKENAIRNLVEAACEGDPERINRIMASYPGLDVNEGDWWRDLALVEAARGGIVPVLEALINAGADVNKTNPGYESPLSAAAGGGHLDAAEFLLKNGADIRNKKNINPLESAIEENKLDMVKFLIGKGANVHVRLPYLSPMEVAKKVGNVELINILSEAVTTNRAGIVQSASAFIDNEQAANSLTTDPLHEKCNPPPNATMQVGPQNPQPSQ